MKTSITVIIAAALLVIACKKESTSPTTTNTAPTPTPTPTAVVSDTTIVFNIILFKSSSINWYSPKLTVYSNAFSNTINLTAPGSTTYPSQCSQPSVAYSVPMKKGVKDTISIVSNDPFASASNAKFVFDLSIINPVPIVISNTNFGGVCNVSTKKIFVGM